MRISIAIADAFAKAYAARISSEISKAKSAKQECVDLHPTQLRIDALKDAEDAVTAAAAAAAVKAKKDQEAATKASAQGADPQTSGAASK